MTDDQAASWRDQVRLLAESLTRLGCVVRCDLFEYPPPDWSRWGPEMIKKCDFTLIVTSRGYRQRWEGSNPPHEGAGAAREINVLKGRFDKYQPILQKRTIIVMLPGVTKEGVPDEIYAYLQRFSLDPAREEHMIPLLRHLTAQPEFVLPELGRLPELPPLPPVTSEAPGPDAQGPKPPAIEVPASLPWATSYRDEVSRLVARIQAADPPPDRPARAGDLDEWVTSLASWADGMSSLVKAIEHVRSLAAEGPPIRFLLALDGAKTGMEHMHGQLDTPRTLANTRAMADAAAEVWNAIVKLVDQLLEP